MLTLGSGKFTVNGRHFGDYFERPVHRQRLHEPLDAVSCNGRYDITASVHGGGLSGQCGAIVHGLSRCLSALNPEAFRHILKSEGLLRRDPRMVERKKPGQKKARKKFQWVKR